MKPVNYSALIIVFIVMSVLLTNIGYAIKFNMIKNPSFEADFKFWSFIGDFPNSTQAFTISSNDAADGAKSFNATNLSEFYGTGNMINQKITPLPDKKLLEVSFYYKGSNLNDTVTGIDLNNSNGLQLALESSTGINDWAFILRLNATNIGFITGAFNNTTNPLYVQEFTVNKTNNWNFIKIKLNHTGMPDFTMFDFYPFTWVVTGNYLTGVNPENVDWIAIDNVSVKETD